MRKFLLHACCAPCGITAIDELRTQYVLTVFFYNPNIHPFTEYEKRKKEIVKLCKEWDIPMVDGDYEAGVWFEKTRGLENEPEGGARCGVCIGLRLEKTAALAKRLGAGIFGTTLSMGRNKKAEVINRLGAGIAHNAKLEFFEVDWKKGGRQQKADKMIEERKIYRQNYCGCKYSLR